MTRTAPPPLPRPRHRLTLALWPLALAAGVAVLLVLHFFPPGQYAIYPVCPLKQGTGLDCPGCGGLRAMHQLTNGNLAAAWRLNPFVFLILPLAAYETIVRGALQQDRFSVLSRPRLLIALGLFLLAFTLVRNLPLLAHWLT